MSDFGENSSGLQNPIFKIMCSGEKNLKNNNSNVTMMPNPMNLNNNNNLGESTMVDLSSVNMSNIDDMLNEISKSLMNLQTDINRVMLGINQINFLISKIQQFRANNSNLEMGSNLIMSNNMMNNMANMINPMNLNMNMNSGIMPIQSMMPIPPLVNMVPIEPIMPKKTFNVFFRESGRNINDNNRKITYMNVKGDEKVGEIIQRYRERNSDYRNLKFIFNAKSLNPLLRIDEEGLLEGANIFVVAL